MKILQLTKFYPPVWGGIEAVTYEITEGLNRAGYRCDVLCANDKFTRKNETFNEQYNVTRTASMAKVLSTSLSPQLISRLNNIKDEYDIIHVHFPDPLTALALYICKPAKSKIIIHWHSDIIRQSGLLKFYQPLERWVLKNCDKIIGTSERYIESSPQLKDFLEKTVVIPIGISGNNLTANNAKKKELKKVWQNKKVVFALGRMVYYKGFEHLIKAATHLDENTIVIIGGTGPLYNHYEKLISKLSLTEKVLLVGHIKQEDIGAYYETCDIFCFPSVARSEAFGVAQLEAMYFAKPVVATDITGSGVPWVNLDGVSGYNVVPADPVALAEKINYILSNPDIYKKLSQGAIQRYQQTFSSEMMIKAVIKLYEDIIS